MNRRRATQNAIAVAVVLVVSTTATAPAQLHPPTVPNTATVAPPTAATVPATAPTTRSTPPVATVPNPLRIPRRTGELTDTAGIIPPRNEQAITDELVASRARAGSRLEVLTVRSLKDWDAESYGLDAFAATAFEAWNLGDPIRHDGALVVIVKEPPRSVTVTGPWYQHTTDEAINSVLDATLTPAFAKREYTRGIRESVQAIARILSLPIDGVAATESTDVGAQRPRSQLPKIPLWTYGSGAVPLAVLAFLFGWRRRNPPAHCPQCGNAMSVCSDPLNADVTLEGGVPVPSWLDSNGLRLWSCNVCGQHLVGHTRTPTSNCPACSKTLPVALLEDVRGATSEEPGIVRITRACSSCDHRNERILSLPKLSQGGRFGASHLR